MGQRELGAGERENRSKSGLPIGRGHDDDSAIRLLTSCRAAVCLSTTTQRTSLILTMQPEEEDPAERVSRKHEKRKKKLERELKDLQSGYPSSESLSREQRRVAAAAAAQARLEGKTGTGTEDQGPERRGRPRGRTMPVLYDEQGTHMNSGRNLCDCLNPECPGCHFPCKSCGSNKCGRKCRNHRKWMYTQAVEQLPFDESRVIRTRPV